MTEISSRFNSCATIPWPCIEGDVIRAIKFFSFYLKCMCTVMGGERGQSQTCRRILYSSLKIYFTEDYSLCGREIAACLLSALCLFHIRTI